MFVLLDLNILQQLWFNLVCDYDIVNSIRQDQTKIVIE